MSRVVSFIAMVLVVIGGSVPAQASAPLREGPFSFHAAGVDFFAPSGQSCRFPVTGSWDVVVSVTTFFHSGTDAPARVVAKVVFDGTLSNPRNGKSVPDASHHDTITDYFAADGTFIKEVENESRDNSLLRAAFHFVLDGDGNVVADSGRDWFTTATSIVDIGPLCLALS